MSFKVLINSLKNRIGIANEIPSTIQKEGQCDGDEEKMCELDAFKQENAEMIE